MTVTGHDHVSLALNRALQNAVIIWIVADDVECDVRNDKLSYSDHPLRSTDNTAFFPLEIPPEDACSFVNNGR
jgi:hypothetical protein